MIDLPMEIHRAIAHARYDKDKDALIEALERACSWWSKRSTHERIAVKLEQENARAVARARANDLANAFVRTGVLQTLVTPTDEMIRHAASMVAEGIGTQRGRRRKPWWKRWLAIGSRPLGTSGNP